MQNYVISNLTFHLIFVVYSNDIINRFAYPMVPDMGICCLQQNYMFLRNNIYRNKTVQLARSAVLHENVVIHQECKVAEGTEIANSVIGRACKIERNCVLENAFVFDGVTIGEKCVLKNCIVGKDAIISKESAIHGGSVIGNGCHLIDRSDIGKKFVVSKRSEDAYDDGTFLFI